LPDEAALICFHKFGLLPPTNTCLNDGEHPPTNTCLNDGEQCLGGEISNRCKTGVRNSRSTPTKTEVVVRNLPQLQQLSSVSTNLPHSPPTITIKKAVMNNSK
jgi:hypothetical protein